MTILIANDTFMSFIVHPCSTSLSAPCAPSYFFLILPLFCTLHTSSKIITPRLHVVLLRSSFTRILVLYLLSLGEYPYASFFPHPSFTATPPCYILHYIFITSSSHFLHIFITSSSHLHHIFTTASPHPRHLHHLHHLHHSINTAHLYDSVTVCIYEVWLGAKLPQSKTVLLGKRWPKSRENYQKKAKFSDRVGGYPQNVVKWRDTYYVTKQTKNKQANKNNRTVSNYYCLCANSLMFKIISNLYGFILYGCKWMMFKLKSCNMV